MSAPAWLAELRVHAARYGALGITPDLAALTLAEAWGVFVFLRRLAEAQST